MKIGTFWLLAIALTGAVAVAPLVASEKAQDQDMDELPLPFEAKPEKGRVLAYKLCASCHVVAPDQESIPAEPGIPSFMAIAGSPGRDEDYLIGKMMHPFPPMIDAHLSDHEMRNLSAFILSLKKTP